MNLFRRPHLAYELERRSSSDVINGGVLPQLQVEGDTVLSARVGGPGGPGGAGGEHKVGGTPQETARETLGVHAGTGSVERRRRVRELEVGWGRFLVKNYIFG